MQIEAETWSCLQTQLSVNTTGRGFSEITSNVADAVTSANVGTGLCHVFVHHTSASLIICENADPQVLDDMEAYMQGLVTDGDPVFTHRAEGADDMAAHVRSVLTHSALTLPVTGGCMALGAWQGLFLWEHRYQRFSRRITVTVQGIAGRDRV